MQKYINQNGEKRYFIGDLPIGWQEMTDAEIQQEEQEKQEQEQIKLRIAKAMEIYNSAPLAFQEMFYNSFLFISSLAQSGRITEAISLIEGKEVPQEIENTKQLLLEAMKGV